MLGGRCLAEQMRVGRGSDASCRRQLGYGEGTILKYRRLVQQVFPESRRVPAWAVDLCLFIKIAVSAMLPSKLCAHRYSYLQGQFWSRVELPEGYAGVQGHRYICSRWQRPEVCRVYALRMAASERKRQAGEAHTAFRRRFNPRRLFEKLNLVVAGKAKWMMSFRGNKNRRRARHTAVHTARLTHGPPTTF